MAARMRLAVPSLVGLLADVLLEPREACLGAFRKLERFKMAGKLLCWRRQDGNAPASQQAGETARQRGAMTTANKRRRVHVCSASSKDMIQFALPPWCALACERACHLSLSAAFSLAPRLAWRAKGRPGCSAEGGASTALYAVYVLRIYTLHCQHEI